MPITETQKAGIEDVIKTLLGVTVPKNKRALCGMFMDLVDREEWPHYYEVIPEPRCLHNIKAGVAKGRYKEPADVYTDLSLVFWNALYYNEPGSQITLDAETLKTTLHDEWTKKPFLGVPRTSPPPSSPQKVHRVPDPHSNPAKPVQAQSTLTSTPKPASTTKMPQPTATSAKPVPIRPKSVQRQASPDMEVDIMSADDGAVDDTAIERDPESEEIVKQLEKGLPRWTGFGEDGWMEEASPEKLLELVHVIKNHKDVAGNRLATSLEAVPEESTIPYLSYTTPLSLKLIESRARGKKYENAKAFDKEIARLFEKARRYHEPCSEAYGHVLLLQRLYQSLTSSNPPSGPPYISTTNFAGVRAGPGTTKPVHGGVTGEVDGVAGVTTHRVLTRDRKFVDEVQYKGWTLKLADWVHLSNPDDPSRPIIAQVFRCWISEEPAKAGQPGITVSWYYRPEQTFHTSDRKFWEGEVFKTSHFADHPIEDLIEKIACQFTARHIRGRPRPPYWYLGFPLYVCDSRYNDRDRIFVKIKNWNSCIPEEVRKSNEFMPIYPFERTVYPIRFPSPYLVKGSKLKGPGGVVPATVDATEEYDKKRGTRKVSAGDAGPSKGTYVGPSTMTTTTNSNHASAPANTSTITPVTTSAPVVSAPVPVQAQYYQPSTYQQYQQPVQTSTSVYRPPGPDRSVVTAAGGAVLGGNIQVDKLPPETTKHFDRDPYTNEMLWFSAPPLNIARPPSARYSLTYLHFLAMKRKNMSDSNSKKEDGGKILEVNGNGNENGAEKYELTNGERDENGEPKRKKLKEDIDVRETVTESSRRLWIEMGMDDVVRV